MNNRASRMRRKAFEFVEQLERLGNADQIMDELVKTLNKYGIAYSAMSFLPSPTVKSHDYAMLIERLPPGFMSHYLAEDWLPHDPALRHCRVTLLPFRWVHEAPYNRLTEPLTVTAVNGMAELGLSDGYVVPVISSRHRMGQVFVGGDDIALPDDELRALHFMAVYAFDRVLMVRNDGAGEMPITTLTAREREALTLAATGLSTEDISERLHISARTVTWHIRNSCEKLGVVNRTAAVAMAVRDRLIIL